MIFLYLISVQISFLHSFLVKYIWGFYSDFGNLCLTFFFLFIKTLLVKRTVIKNLSERRELTGYQNNNIENMDCTEGIIVQLPCIWLTRG